MLAEYLEKSAKELIDDVVNRWNLPYAVEFYLQRRLGLRDAEILAKIEIGREVKESDTLPPENDEEKTKVDNSI